MKTADIVALSVVAGLAFLGWQYMQKQQAGNYGGAGVPPSNVIQGPWAGASGAYGAGGTQSDVQAVAGTVGDVAKVVGSIFDMFKD